MEPRLTPAGKFALVILALGIAVMGYRLFPRHQSSSLPQNGGPGQNGGPAGTLTEVEVKGRIGGEKSGLLEDPDIIKLLATRYKIKVSADRAGSLEMVRSASAGMDFLWPSSQVALDLYKSQSKPLRKAEVLLNSPIVMYSWDATTRALVKAAIAQRVDNAYYIVNMPRLVDLMIQNKRWKDIGQPDLYGPIAVQSTDPTKSNSGMMFAGLLANILNGGEVVNGRTVDKTLPRLKQFFGRLGYMQHGSGEMFDQFLQMGEGAYPLIVGYENQLIEFAVTHPQYRDTVRQQVRLLYPKPTVWSAHPLIALTANGERLITAFQDPEVQKIAWERHGFRSGALSVGSKPMAFNGIVDRVQSVVPIPSSAAMDKIIAALGHP